MAVGGKPGSTPELASKKGLHRTVPDSHATIAVTATSAGTADALAAYAGQWVWLGARGGDITLRRYSGSAPTLVLNVGWTISDGSTEEVFVDPHGAMDLAHISSAAVTLDIHYDSEQGG